ncbi:MAG: SDR family oxidoreductase [bacterium]
MAFSHDFHIMASSLPGWADSGIARAAIRAGELGLINGESAPSESALVSALAELRVCPRERCGVRLDLGDNVLSLGILKHLPPHIGWVILARATPAQVAECVPRLHSLNVRVLIEAVTVKTAEAADAAGADGVIAKGNESGGWVGEETTFILLQRLRRVVTLPVWVQGGIGAHTLAAAYVGGAAGVILDSPLALLQESPLPQPIRARIERMDGAETRCLGDDPNFQFRALPPFGTGDENRVWPLGQDASFAGRLAERYGTVGRALRGLRAGLRSHLRAAQGSDSLMRNSPWSVAHATEYPIAQGPMTRVSDSPAFAEDVAAAGGLPFLALGVQRATEIDPLLVETRRRLGVRPWGVGLLGFLDTSLRDEQWAAVRMHHPPFALIAGGQPEQARLLEQDGIRTYLHVPTPELLKLFIEDGARRFVFEGRECGGHVGPLSSFMLWELAAQTLLESIPASELPSCHVLLAGGIHNALSAAMASASMAALTERGVKVGVLMGTAYLFTREAISSGAILNAFQNQALACRHTVLLETGPGHVVRCAPTPYADTFASQKSRLLAGGTPPDQLRSALEMMNIGRLRLAAKGVIRRDNAPEELVAADEEEQLAEGLYMLGQAASLHNNTGSVKELHQDVSIGGTAILREIHTPSNDMAPLRAGDRDGIAIVGMSCLLPGADKLDLFWTNILNKVNAIREVPATRWDWKLYFDERRETADRVYARWGGFLEPIPFNPAHYGMPPASLSSIEPIQLLALETARAALKDAGYENKPFPRENTSVILGVSGGLAELGQDYVLRSALAARPDGTLAGFSRPLPEWTEDSFAGILLNVIAGRIANRFDLGGPSFTVDAACASSLAAVYMACRELESGASDMTLVGGADTFQTPFNYLCFCKTHALSPRGRCRTFDHTADGTCISEGLSMLVLKRVSDAERDGNRIYAVIRGVGASSDGRAKGLTAPSPEGQARALHRAYALAGVSPSTIGLVEAHGTGTEAGDRAEIESLRRVFEAAGAAPHSVALGSVKSMIGHTKGAAGVTGLIKVAMALRHKVLPATIGVEKPNHSLVGGALYANTGTRPWIGAPGDHPRRAAVSAFGFGGANYHVVVEEYDGETPGAATPQWPCELFLWRGASTTEILRHVTELRSALKSGAQPALKDLSFSLWKQAEQSPRDTSLAIVASSLGDLTAKLDTILAALTSEATAPVWDSPSGIYLPGTPLAGNAGIAFLFPGQGSQYPDMLSELAVHFHEIREAFEAADHTLTARFNKPLSSFVFPPPRFSEDEERAARLALTATNVAQPALGAAIVGLLNLLRALGVKPDAVAGHSYGEVAALYAAGCLTPEPLFELSESRGRFILEEGRGDLGTMAAVEANEEQTRALIGDRPDLWIANLNSPRQTIISGTKAAVAAALKHLESQDIPAQGIPVSCAFHSPLVAPAKQRLQDYLSGVRFEEPKLRVYSNATGGTYPSDPDAIRIQLAEHLVSPVRFVSEIEAMAAAGTRVFVEVGPRQVLTGLTEQILGNRERIVIPLETRKRSGLEGLLHALAQLAAQGAPVQLDRLYEGRQPRGMTLDRLVEDTREAPLSPTAWWVDGGHATPCVPSQPALPPPLPVQPPPAPVPLQRETGDLATLLNAHEQVMQHLLDTHRRVMAAALGKGEVPGRLAPPVTALSPAPPPPVVANRPDPVKPVPAAPAVSIPQVSDSDRIRQEVLRVVGERTGYPPDMLDVDADLEADLGIDSIKRVEIAGRLRKVFPHLGATPDASAAGNLSSLRTLRGLIERIASVPVSGEVVPLKPAGDAKPAVAVTIPPVEAARVPRFAMHMEDAPITGTPATLPSDGVFIITDDEGGIAGSVAEAIRKQGSNAVVFTGQKMQTVANTHHAVDFSNPKTLSQGVATVRHSQGRIAGIIHLLPLRGRPQVTEMTLDDWRKALQEDVKALFFLAQAAAEDLKAPSSAHHARILAAVHAHGGFPGHGGIAGLINTLVTEWPGVIGRTLALDGGDPVPVLATRILDDLQCGDESRFTGFRDGRRQRIHIVPADLDLNAKDPLSIGSDWVIMLTGGACGITAQVAIELADRFKPTLVLVGRSPLPETEEPSFIRGVESPAEMRRLLAGQLSKPGSKATLAEIETAYRRVCREREIRATLAALRKTGARAIYCQTDVRDKKAFEKTMDRIYTDFGRLDGVIHGAGVIEDKRMEDKTPESFDRVFDTKADSAFVLARHLRLDSLKFLAFFSSVAVLGNAGQSDYAAANGVLNALARDLDRLMPGRVVALLWGPWQSAGMASEENQRQFLNRGVQIIPLDAGRRSFVTELEFGRKGDVEALFGDAPYARPSPSPDHKLAAAPLLGGLESLIHNNGTIEIACVLDPSRHVYLRDHQLDGKPVFPAAMAMELMAESAWAASTQPGGLIEIGSLHVQQGIVLGHTEPKTVRVRGARAASPSGAASFSMQIHSEGAGNRAHYRALVTLGEKSEPPGFDPAAFQHLDPFPLGVSEAYAHWLFQGPCFAGITKIMGINRNTIAGILQSVSPALCLSAAANSHWLVDPTVVDASLQLVILWERHWHDMTPLPMQIGRFRVFHSLSGQPVQCLVKATTSDEGELLTADLFYTDTQGRLLAMMEGLQCACTKSLNRLGHAAREGRKEAACD